MALNVIIVSFLFRTENLKVNFLRLCKKIIYHTYQTDYVSYNSFNKLTLPKNFIRCHKSFIVNIDNISNISYADNIIYLKNGSTCYIGPKYKNSLLEVIRYDSVS